MKQFLTILCLCLLLCGCNDNSNEVDIKTIMKENKYVIIDVRSEDEYEASHIVDAINIPYNEINEDIDLDKDKTIFVYCKSGTRSKLAFDKLVDLGYIVYDLGTFSEIDLPKE